MLYLERYNAQTHKQGDDASERTKRGQFQEPMIEYEQTSHARLTQSTRIWYLRTRWFIEATVAMDEKAIAMD